MSAPEVKGVSVHGLLPEHVECHTAGSGHAWATLGMGVVSIHGDGDTAEGLDNLEAIGMALVEAARSLRSQLPVTA